jgi:hypothetical protein
LKNGSGELMRKLLILMCGVLALAGVVRAAVAELDTDLMQTIEDTNKSMASNIATGNKKAAISDAAELHEMFLKVEAFYVQKGDAQDAVDLSRKTLQLTQQIGQQVQGGKFDDATNAATDLARTCKSCHNFYKKS